METAQCSVVWRYWSATALYRTTSVCAASPAAMSPSQSFYPTPLPDPPPSPPSSPALQLLQPPAPSALALPLSNPPFHLHLPSIPGPPLILLSSPLLFLIPPLPHLVLHNLSPLQLPPVHLSSTCHLLPFPYQAPQIWQPLTVSLLIPCHCLPQT